MTTPKKPRKVDIHTRRLIVLSEGDEGDERRGFAEIVDKYFEEDLHKGLINRIADAVNGYRVVMKLRPPPPNKQSEDLRLLIESLRESEKRLANIPLFAIRFAQQKFVPFGQRHRLGRPKLEEEIIETRAHLAHLAGFLDEFLNTFDLEELARTNPGKPERDALVLELLDIFHAGTEDGYEDSANERASDAAAFVSDILKMAGLNDSIDIARLIQRLHKN
ncbi:hypothetical protein [Methylocaldum sp. 14B]|uniref:hypothetical protein n=1 Tax=Methylocaldum sp. 14B TaxID=1912213 RepID=UPI00098BA452|nr:hypothetical protein [Methylocaldum sp. 14B]